MGEIERARERASEQTMYVRNTMQCNIQYRIICQTYTGVEVTSTERVPTVHTTRCIGIIEQVNVNEYVWSEAAAKERYGRNRYRNRNDV